MLRPALECGALQRAAGQRTRGGGRGSGAPQLSALQTAESPVLLRCAGLELQPRQERSRLGRWVAGCVMRHLQSGISEESLKRRISVKFTRSQTLSDETHPPLGKINPFEIHHFTMP